MESLTDFLTALQSFINWWFEVGTKTYNDPYMSLAPMFGLVFYVAGISCAIIIYGTGLSLVYLVLIKPFRMYDKRRQDCKYQQYQQEQPKYVEAKEPEELVKLRERLKAMTPEQTEQLYAQDAEDYRKQEEAKSPELRREEDLICERLQRDHDAAERRNQQFVENLRRERQEREAEENRIVPSFSEYLWTNPHVREREYNRIGRILDKLDKM